MFGRVSCPPRRRRGLPKIRHKRWRVGRMVSEKMIPGREFRDADSSTNNGDRLTFYREAKVSHAFKAEQPGSYHLALELEVAGQFDFDPGRCKLVFKTDDRELIEQEFGWQNGKRFHFDFDQTWEAGEHILGLEVHPLTPAEKKKNSLDLRMISVRV